ncbi:MAG: hypothetical protein JSR72_23775 [Proteobacteria bacterium]|nr:hypothetical protein [Pseudomonadota bacterium]
MTTPSPETIARVQFEFARQEAREHQRRLMQGLGRPIISWQDGSGTRFVCIGMQVRWSKAWKTFPDFLFDYIKLVLTPEWGNAELKKPVEQRHPLLQWYHKLCTFQHAQTKNADGIYQAEATGAVSAYLGLAYDLYLCAHNAELPELLLKRLRNPETFEGARYEARIIGSLARAGFTIELEDETDSNRTHCELTASHKDTGRKFSVECKAISSTNARAGTSTDPVKIRSQLYKALSKQADHERIIFIELNRAGSVVDGQTPDWVRDLDADLERAEKQLTIDGQPAPPAYLFITNQGAVHAMDSTAFMEIWLGCGFKIPDFGSAKPCRSILELIDAREKHVELHWLGKALRAHHAIPNMFDDRLPEEIDAGPIPRLLIGSTYLIPTADAREEPAVLVEASVLVPEKRIYGIYRCADGRQIICTNEITNAELAAYKRSPETFFGVVKKVSPEIKDPIDAFDFFWNSYSTTSKEKLVEFTRQWPDATVLQALDQKRLAQIYCARMAENMWMTMMRDRTNPPAT